MLIDFNVMAGVAGPGEKKSCSAIHKVAAQQNEKKVYEACNVTKCIVLLLYARLFKNIIMTFLNVRRRSPIPLTTNILFMLHLPSRGSRIQCIIVLYIYKGAKILEEALWAAGLKFHWIFFIQPV